MSTSTSGKPLIGKCVLITRSAYQLTSTADKLAALGADVLSLPATSIEPEEDSLDQAVQKLDKVDWLIFASVNAVTFFLEHARKKGTLYSLSAKIAVVGEATARALEPFDQKAAFVPSSFNAVDFVREFAKSTDVAGKKILWPRGNRGRMTIYDELQKLGAQIESPLCYVNVLPEDWQPAAKLVVDSLRASTVHAALFASSQAAYNLQFMFDQLQGSDSSTELLSKVKIIAIGHETAAACTQCFGRCDGIASPHTIDGLIDCLVTSLKPLDE